MLTHSLQKNYTESQKKLWKKYCQEIEYISEVASLGIIFSPEKETGGHSDRKMKPVELRIKANFSHPRNMSK